MPAVHHIDEQRLHLGAGDRVEGREGLVGKQQLGLAGQRPGQRGPLGHAARELRRVGALAPGQADGFDGRRHPGCARRLAGAGLVGEIEAEAHVVGEAEPGQQAGLLEHQRAARMGLGQRLVEKAHLTGGGPFQAGQHAQQRRLAAAAASEQRHDLAPADRQGDAVEHAAGPGMGKRQPAGVQHRLRGLYPGEGGVDQRRVHAALNAAWRASSPWSWVRLGVTTGTKAASTQRRAKPPVVATR